MSVAKKAFDSTLKRILVYTAEIIVSIILLVVISLPLVFVIPLWLQQIALGTPRHQLFMDPVAMFGYAGVSLIILVLGVLSVLFGYFILTGLSRERKEKPKESSEQPEAGKEEPTEIIEESKTIDEENETTEKE